LSSRASVATRNLSQLSFFAFGGTGTPACAAFALGRRLSPLHCHPEERSDEALASFLPVEQCVEPRASRRRAIPSKNALHSAFLWCRVSSTPIVCFGSLACVSVRPAVSSDVPLASAADRPEKARCVIYQRHGGFVS
jgi:hypothetical protein